MRARLKRPDLLTGLGLAVLATAFAFGGGSRLNELRLALVELAALPLLVLCAARAEQDDLSAHKLFFGVAAAVVAVPLIQLIPLPPSIWMGLPGREQIVQALDIIDAPVGWLPLSLTPERTWRSALALCAPLAILTAAVIGTHSLRERMILLVLAAAGLFVIIGAAQLASGGVRLYPWPTTDLGSVVGLFANRNHLATLCLMSLPFAIVGMGRAVRRDERLNAWGYGLFIGLMIVALAVIRSRFGLILTVPVLGAGLVAAWIAWGRGRPNTWLLASVAAVALAVAIAGAFALGPALQRFDPQADTEGRFQNWPIVAEAAVTYLPVGSGIGSFDTVYRSVEPLELLDATFFNQAHNEYLETWLEAGWIGAAVIALFLVWFARRTWGAWASGPGAEPDRRRAASIAIGVVLLHSGVDYPLRTVTIACVFALCCALLELAPRDARSS